ncbi:MAG TPA: menaquinone biosynthesis decarboxylase [Bacteroidota bacterium]|nr:menaquinone biosynthesis decarboxylase [Bacteroidota bacterium]
MRFTALREFVQYLEKNGELHRIRVEVDPRLEITEIAVRALREGKPALLFEKVRGSKYPLVINTLASERRIELALGEHPDNLGEQLIAFAERAIPPSPSTLLRHRKVVRRLISSRTSDISIAPSQEVVENPNLGELPVLQCWPHDGGRFLTLPQVFTYDPATGRRNVGMYRMQVFDGKTTGMHWQIQKGGGFHFFRSMKMDRPLEVAVALGTDPAFLLATVAPLPEGIDEAMFAGFLRKRPTQLVGGRSISISVPANAEFVLEGTVPPKERRSEGPFGDHFGHYSAAAEFPVFHLSAITHRKNPIYPATVVGIPPMEDKFLGDATQKILGPLAKLLHTEVRSLWAYYEAGFHNLLAVSIEERYQKEGMKTALGLLGTQQLSLTKCLVTVPQETDPRDFRAVLAAIRENFDPHFDFMLLPKVPLDTLDFTSYTMNLGSKMIIDATKKTRTRSRAHITKKSEHFLTHLSEEDRRIIDSHLVENALLVVKVKHDGGAVLKRLLKSPLLDGVKLLALVSEDVDIHRPESYIWGIFTRFDCERDVLFREQKLVGISPVYRGTLGIDATWKPGYPEPLVMDEKIIRHVDHRWDEYWK